ncbi:MAG: POTRA domain-containing protein, partial [Bryobacteraceae bacterium]
MTVLLVLFFSPMPALFAAAEQYEGMLISVIAFEPREQPIPPPEMAEMLPLKMNTRFDMRIVRAAIERLYATGRYTDIAVDAEVRNGKVVVRFLTKGNWFIGQVSVTGVAAPPRASQLVNDANLNLGEPFRDEDTQTATANMQKTLQRNGFFEAEIHPVFEHDPRTQQVHIRFEVNPGKRDDIGVPIIRGNPLLPEPKIIGATKWHWWFGWRPATATRIQRGLERIRNLYQKRDRLMAEVSLDSLDHNAETRRAMPTLTLDAGPKVEVRSTGAKLSRGQLKQLVPIFAERSVDRDLLYEGVRAITEHFQTKGFFDTRVKFDEKTEGNGNYSILYEIDRGERQKLTHFEIRGNRYFDLMTIRERMLIIPASFQFRRGKFNEVLLNRDISAIADLYRTNGFRNVVVTSRIDRDYRDKRGDIAVFIDIKEGSQWLVSSLAVEGMKADDEAALRPILQSSPGQAFSEMNVAADRDNILAYYYNSGYANATFEWSYQPSAQPNHVDVRFVVTEGPRHYVREVLITGLDATRPQLVNPRILLNPGEPISQARILETQRRLYDLGIFAKVDTALQNPEGDEQYKYVLFQLDEAKKYSISTGFGAEIARIGGSQTSLASPAGEANFSPRVSFDVSRLNFLGRAHTVSFRSRVSTIQRRGLITYVAPQFQGKENLEQSFTALFDESENIRTFSSRKWEGSVQLAHRWTRSKTMFYRFTYRRVSID